VSGIKESKIEKNSRQHGSAIGPDSLAPEVEAMHRRQAEKHGRAWTHDHQFCNFSIFMLFLLLFLEGPWLGFLEGILGFNMPPKSPLGGD